MSSTRIIQYIHRLNKTEVGKGTTHESYLLIDSKTDISDICPPGVEVIVADPLNNRTYKLKSVKGSEFRVNQMGPIYRDYDVRPGDEIILTQYKKGADIKNILSVNTFKRVCISTKGGESEIVNLDRLSPFSCGERQYSFPIIDNDVEKQVVIGFLTSKKKRSDSPTETDYYSILVDGEPLPNGNMFFNISDVVTMTPVVTKSEYNRVFLTDYQSVSSKDANKDKLQVIYYGAPGTGKSHVVNDLTEGKIVYRTTFHPDSDYSTFVGAYKPVMATSERKYSVEELVLKLKEIKNTGTTYPCHKFASKYWESLKDLSVDETKGILSACGFTDAYTVEIAKGIAIGQEYLNKKTEGKIIYTFVPQAFAKAYVNAWKVKDNVYLIIEEINRGNCAQVFGDLFQLLDRKNGFSKYPIEADSDFGDYIADSLADNCREDIPIEVKEGRKLVLPPNLYIWATMNTSDQSLFPIDSAFKRRWDWKYMKIRNYPEKDYQIKIGEKRLPWYGFIEKINEIIASMTSSADKQLGYFFCVAENGEIDEKTFVSKVVFYLWNDVFKDYGFEDASLFQYTEKNEAGNDITKELTFPDFYKEDGEEVDVVRLEDFIEKVMNWKKTNGEND